MARREAGSMDSVKGAFVLLELECLWVLMAEQYIEEKELDEVG